MKELLKYCRVNVEVKDKETDELLFEGHNLFVDIGRAFIADTLRAAISGGVIQPALYACDFGDSAATPTVDDIDLAGTLKGSAQLTDASYPAAMAGEPTGIWFQFTFTNNTGLDITARELGLFYRPDTIGSPAFPGRGSPANAGTMLARLKTTSSSIVIGNSRTITVDWKILF